MSKHTPGPWTVEFKQSWPFGVAITGADGTTVLSNSAWANSTKQVTRSHNEKGYGFDAADRQAAIDAVATQDANAKLMAAAPDLLEALKRLIATGLDQREHHEFMSDPAHYARVAIAKAEGA